MLQEALLLGYQVIGSDKSEKAISDTKRNLEWLKSQIANRKSQSNENNTRLAISPLLVSDVKNLSQKVTAVDAIVTEPYLGPALRGGESQKEIQNILAELEQLYLAAFAEFKKILKPGGKVVIIFPWFKKYNLKLNILAAIEKLGFRRFNQEDLVYGRPEQKVWREIGIFRTWG